MILGLVGPNGSGKSTLMQALVNDRSIKCDGDVIADGVLKGSSPEYLKLLFYSPGAVADLNPKMKVGECLDLVRKMWGSSYETGEAVELLDIERYLNKEVKSLSQGMAQMLYLALSWISGARYVLLDEPMNALDPIGASRAKAVIGDMAQSGRAVVMSSHLLDDIDELCDSIAFITDDTLLLERKVTNCRQRYFELYGPGVERRGAKK